MNTEYLSFIYWICILQPWWTHLLALIIFLWIPQDYLYTIMLSANAFLFLLFQLGCHLFHSCLITLSRPSRTMLDRMVRGDILVLVLILRGNYCPSPLNIMLAVGFLCCFLSDWGSSLLLLARWVFLLWKGITFCKILFLCLLQCSCDFFVLYSIDVVYYIN